MRRDLERIEELVLRRVGSRDQLREAEALVQAGIRHHVQEAEEIARATEVIQAVAKATQEELEVHISELVSLALEAVFPKSYKMVLSFEARRGRSEADLLLEDEAGNQVSPMDSVGGGVVDVASLALRVAMWSLKRPRPRATIILDEPLRFLSADLQDRASTMLKEISKRLGIQFIIVSHEENLLASADKVFRFTNVQGEAKLGHET